MNSTLRLLEYKNGGVWYRPVDLATPNSQASQRFLVKEKTIQIMLTAKIVGKRDVNSDVVQLC